jgi:hypothetical protein
MKITVDLPDKEIREITRLTGISKKGPAIRKLLADTLMLQRRAHLTVRKVKPSRNHGAIDRLISVG